MINNSASTIRLDRGSPGAQPGMKPPAQTAQPFVRILEQPMSRGLRFRYENEERQCIIYGANSTAIRKTFPTIEIVNHNGPASVVVSCVTKDAPYYPHPHQLLLPHAPPSKGIVHLHIPANQPIVSFQQLRLMCAKRSDAEQLLEERKRQNVDPYRTDFNYNAKNMDFSCFRLCFQVYLFSGTQTNNKWNVVDLKPVVSEPIFDKKVLPQLKIYYISHCSAPVTGGQTIVLLTDRIKEGEVVLKFFCEETDWEVIPQTAPPHYHKQVAIIFNSPIYPRQDITKPVFVKLQLKRLTDGAVSEVIPFEMLPIEDVAMELRARKRQRCAETPKSFILKKQESEAMQRAKMIDNRVENRNNVDLDVSYYYDNILTQFSHVNRQYNFIS